MCHPQACCCCSVAQLCVTLCDPMDSSTPGFPVLHQLPELAQTRVHSVNDAIQPSHPLSPPSPPAFNIPSIRVFSVGSSHQVAKVLELQLQDPLNSQVLCLVTQSCPTLCDPIDCSSWGPSVHGILQARILEWVATPSSRGSSQPRDRTQASHIVGRFLTIVNEKVGLQNHCR